MNFTAGLGRLLGIENVSSIDRVESSLAAPWAQGRTAPAWILLACLALGALAAWFYLQRQPSSKGRVRYFLAAVRGLLLSLLLLMLAEPTLLLKLTSSPRPLLWVLFDGTDSMGIEDEPTERGASSAAKKGRSRMELVHELLTKQDGNDFAKLQEKYDLRPFLFDRPDGVRALATGPAEATRFDPAELAPQLTTEGQVTAIGSALADLSRRQTASHLAGLVIFSDFDQNSGPPPLSLAQKIGVPIYAVGVGPVAAVDLRLALQADPKMKKAERKTLEVLLTQEGLTGLNATVKLTAEPRTSPGANKPPATVIGEKTVELKSPSQTVTFDYVPNEAGPFLLVAEAEPLPGEVVTQNNRAEREAIILDDFLRLMFVEYEPAWEWRFIKEVFHRDKLVGTRGFRTFLRSADPAVRQSNELFLATMTPKRSDFFANDVIFLGDMPASTLSTRFCEMTKEFVSKFGGGLVVVSGPRFGPGELAETPLADMLPVIVDPDARMRDEREFTLRLSPGAAQVDFMKLGASDSENRQAWANLGKLPWYQPVARVHPLATVLAEHPADTCVDGKTPQPLLAIRKYGRGEVIYLAFNETWRLRRKHGELYYRQLWGQMIHRLGLSHALGNQKRFVVQTDRQQYQADDKAILTVEAYDEDFEPLSQQQLPDKQLTAELVLPDRQSDGGERLQVVRVAQRKEGVFETQIPLDRGGQYAVRVNDPVTGETQEVRFTATSLSAERRSAVRNVALQQALAAESGGRAYELNEFGALVDDLQVHPRKETSVKVVPLWHTWLAFSLALALMFGEWLVRKAVSLP